MISEFALISAVLVETEEYSTTYLYVVDIAHGLGQ